jgi:glycosyltransferase involved in cell wall biosynthesis
MVSVIIPFYKDCAALCRCLGALMTQSYPSEHIEVIVVDNLSRISLDPLGTQFPRVRWLSEEHPTSYAARNRGVLNATGEILACTDADCIPEDSWLEHGVRAMGKNPSQVVAGRVRLLPAVNRPLNGCEAYEEVCMQLSQQYENVHQRGYCTTANMFTSKRVFEMTGPFRGDLTSSGDREWVQRAVQSGSMLYYEEQAVVWHPRRSTLAEIAAKKRRLAGGALAILRTTTAQRGTILGYVFNRSPFFIDEYRSIRKGLRAVHEPVGPLIFMRVVCVASFVYSVTIFERIRLLLGGRPRRD